VCIDQSSKRCGPDLKLLERIANFYLGIPVTYGGGIRDENDCNDVISAGADRVAVDYSIRKNPHIANEMSARIGIQALVGVFPLTATEGGYPSVLDYATGRQRPIAEELNQWKDGFPFAEALVVDTNREGSLKGFRRDLLKEFTTRLVPTLALGGISRSSQAKPLLSLKNLSGVCIENSLFYREIGALEFSSLIQGPNRYSPASHWQFDSIL
jgi:cyclase